jgi:hypothetical protein
MNNQGSRVGLSVRSSRSWYKRVRGRLVAATGFAIATTVLGGCGRSSAELARTAELQPAAVYRAGHGIKLTNDGARFVRLETAEVAIHPGSAGAVAAVPAQAVLRTIKGPFVFVVNGEWLLRTPVVVGANRGDLVEIADGLYEGDHVVVNGVDTLWLAEIAAVNGGVGCADGH